MENIENHEKQEPAMRVKIWGARGSLPAPQTPSALEFQIRRLMEDYHESGDFSMGSVEHFLSKLPRHRFGGFGGNTPCMEVISGGQSVIIDGGSGLRQLGYQLMAGPCGRGAGEVHLVFTHFHWDHLIGLPFFVPLFIPGNKIHVYAVQDDLPEVFKTLFRKPYFPVQLEQLGAKIIYHRLEPRKEFTLGNMKITPYQLDHPDPCWGYKFESGGKTFSYCVDTECVRVSQEELGPDLPLYQNVDLMIFDAQYTLLETIEKVNWGHAAASLGLDIAMREGIKRVVFIHHDPASGPEKIAAAEEQARRYYMSQIKGAKRAGQKTNEVQWSFGFEGMILEV